MALFSFLGASPTFALAYALPRESRGCFASAGDDAVSWSWASLWGRGRDTNHNMEEQVMDQVAFDWYMRRMSQSPVDNLDLNPALYTQEQLAFAFAQWLYTHDHLSPEADHKVDVVGWRVRVRTARQTSGRPLFIGYLNYNELAKGQVFAPMIYTFAGRMINKDVFAGKMEHVYFWSLVQRIMFNVYSSNVVADSLIPKLYKREVGMQDVRAGWEHEAEALMTTG